MDLLADENQHPIVIARLRAAGYRVEAVAETAPGTADEDILQRPDIGRLVLLTYDRDFGQLIFRRGMSPPAALLYTRLNRVEPQDIADRLLAVLEAGVVPGHIVTITRDGARTTPFPPGADNA